MSAPFNYWNGDVRDTQKTHSKLCTECFDADGAEAAKIIDIALLDHVIVDDPKADPDGLGRYSSCEAGLLSIALSD